MVDDAVAMSSMLDRDTSGRFRRHAKNSERLGYVPLGRDSLIRFDKRAKAVFAGNLRIWRSWTATNPGTFFCKSCLFPRKNALARLLVVIMRLVE